MRQRDVEIFDSGNFHPLRWGESGQGHLGSQGLKTPSLPGAVEQSTGYSDDLGRSPPSGSPVHTEWQN